MNIIQTGNILPVFYIWAYDPMCVVFDEFSVTNSLDYDDDHRHGHWTDYSFVHDNRQYYLRKHTA